MDTENSTNVLSTATSFFTETSGDACITQRKRRLLNPFILVISTDGLFRSCNQIFLGRAIWVICLSRDFVQLLIEVIQLCDTSHNILLHKERRLQNIVSTSRQEGDTIIDNSLIQKNACICQKISTVSSHIGSTLRFISTDTPKQFIVCQRFGFGQGILDLALGSRQDSSTFRRSGLQVDNKIVLFFVVGNGDFGVDNVPDAIQQLIALLCVYRQESLLFFDESLDCLHFRNFIAAILFCFLLGSNLFLLNFVDVFSQLVDFVRQIAPLRIFGNDLVHPLWRLEACFHILAIFGRVSALVISQFVDIDRHVDFVQR
mmetsp:Transcript_34577/g.99589  ORF Transcript_34577/g.99589 Transcript_34577/m.99589 type:complete len:316 (-) Transcript_34577:25-972(-)